jgi:hypothetical protein
VLKNYSSRRDPAFLGSDHTRGQNPGPPRLGHYIILVSECAVFRRPPQQLQHNHVASSPWMATSSTPRFNASQACKELGGSHPRPGIGPDPSSVKLYCADAESRAPLSDAPAPASRSVWYTAAYRAFRELLDGVRLRHLKRLPIPEVRPLVPIAADSDRQGLRRTSSAELA